MIQWLLKIHLCPSISHFDSRQTIPTNTHNYLKPLCPQTPNNIAFVMFQCHVQFSASCMWTPSVFHVKSPTMQRVNLTQQDLKQWIHMSYQKLHNKKIPSHCLPNMLAKLHIKQIVLHMWCSRRWAVLPRINTTFCVDSSNRRAQAATLTKLYRSRWK